MSTINTFGKVMIGIGGLSLGAFMGSLAVREERYQYMFKNSDTIKEPFRILKGYPHSEDLLGENIKMLRIDVSDKFNKKNKDIAQMVIPVKGSKGTGKIYSWLTNIAENDHSDEKSAEIWRVDRADLVLHKKVPFTFFMHPDAKYVEDIKLKETDLT